MIIDLILDAKDGDYIARGFYNRVNQYESEYDSNWPITRALEGGANDDVVDRLCEYVDDNCYDPTIKEFIRSFTWVLND